MNTYTVSYTDNISTGAQTNATVVAKQFSFTGGFVVFADDQGHSVFTVPTDRLPVITLTAVGQ